MSGDEKSKNVCRFYRNGVCISPKLRYATDAITSASRCLQGGYIGCRFYIDDGKKEGLELFIDFAVVLKGSKKEEEKSRSVEGKGRDDNDNDRNGNSNNNNITIMSECENFEKIKTKDGNTLMKCKVLNRILPTSVANLCVSHYASCPFRTVRGG